MPRKKPGAVTSTINKLSGKEGLGMKTIAAIVLLWTGGNIGQGWFTSTKFDEATSRVERAAPKNETFEKMAGDISDIKREIVDNGRAQSRRDDQQDRAIDSVSSMIDKMSESIERYREAGASKERVAMLEKTVSEMRADLEALKKK